MYIYIYIYYQNSYIHIIYIVIYIYKYTHVHTYILAKLVKNLSKISGNPANTIIKNFILIALSF